MAKPRTKTAFVLRQPLWLNASRVVELGKARGMLFSSAFVHTVRSNARRSARSSALALQRAVSEGPAQLQTLHETLARMGQSPAAAEAFAELALQIGLRRTSELLSQIRTNARSVASSAL